MTRFWVLRLSSVLGAIIIVSLLVAGFTPIQQDEVLPSDRWGVGADTSLPFYAGLDQQMRPTNAPADNPTTQQKAALGRLLFFDPILSRNNDMSCSTCHHPDLGFSDGRSTAMGAGGKGVGPERMGGVEFPRNTLSQWNVAYNTNFLWNGALSTLEQVAAGTIVSPEEFDSTPDEVTAKLENIPQYVRLFDAAFGGGVDSITFTNITKAIASFQRTLLSSNSPYDRYVAGDFETLTPQQRRGLDLFRSARTRCNDCHSAPGFSDDGFSVTGVPPLPGSRVDPGRAEVDPQGTYRAFKAPTLRNIALTAPYMHNGVFTSLEQVIDFYAQGGGRKDGVQNVDVHVQGFSLSESERADLVAFLYALTDESTFAGIPASVPSGLIVIPRLENHAREKVRELVAANIGEPHLPRVLSVGTGQSIQSVIDQARAGDTVQVPFGRYEETVLVDEPNLRLIGLPNVQGDYPVLVGSGILADGIVASADGFELASMNFEEYTGAAVVIKNASDVYLHDLSLRGNGRTGIDLELCSDVRVEQVEVTGMESAGVFAGSSQRISIVGVESFGNSVGIQVENSVYSEVHGNHVYKNALGILVALQPHLASKVSLYNKVYDNLIENNNADPTDIDGLPRDIGILILAADRLQIKENNIRGHNRAGLVVLSTTEDFGGNKTDVGIRPEFLEVHGNRYDGNRIDIEWDGTGFGNAFDDQAVSAEPVLLPSGRWTVFFYNVYSRVLGILGR